MNPWFAVLLASLAVFSWKFVGYLVPSRLLESKNLQRLAGFLTIALLSGLVGVQTFVTGRNLVFDFRLVSLAVAGIFLKLRAPFIVIVLVAGAVAAALRYFFG